MTDRLALVTGGLGFIGRHVARLLANGGWTVHGLGEGAATAVERANLGYERWVQAEVTVEALQGWGLAPHIVVHCAGSGSVGATEREPDRSHARTVGSVEAVLEYLRYRAPLCTMVLASSAAVYGSGHEREIKEKFTANPSSLYGKHKVICETLCQETGQRYGIPWVAVRLFSVYGRGLRKQLLWDACQKLTCGEARFFGTGEETRDWLHVEDAALLLASAGKWASPSGLIVNGGTGVGASIREVLAVVAGALGSGLQPSFSGCLRPGDPPHLVADVGVARAAGWTASRNWRDGVQDYARWFIESGEPRSPR